MRQAIGTDDGTGQRRPDACCALPVRCRGIEQRGDLLLEDFRGDLADPPAEAGRIIAMAVHTDPVARCVAVACHP